MPVFCSSVTTPTQPRHSTWPLITLAVGFIMAMLDVTIVNVALGHIQASLSVPLSVLVWVVDGYTLTFATLLLVGGALANRYGARAVYMIGLSLFVTASLLCSLAPNGDALIAARLLQGVGAALFMPSSLSLLSYAYTDSRLRIRMLGIWSTLVSVAVAVGPLVGGLIVATLGWRGIFWLNVPLGLIGLLLTRRHLVKSPQHRQALNPAGHVLGIVALGALAFAMIEGATYGWASTPILIAFALAVTGGTGFALYEYYVATPIMPRDLIKDVHFAATNGIGFFINIGAYGLLFLISLYFQQARGADAWHTGLDLLPLLAMFTAGNLFSNRIMARWGLRPPMLFGLAASGLLSAIVTVMGTALPYVLLNILMATANLGIGIAIPAMTATMMHIADQKHANIAAATLNANRQIGALIGVAAMGVVLHLQPDWRHALPLAFGVITLAYASAAVLTKRYISVKI